MTRPYCQTQLSDHQAWTSLNLLHPPQLLLCLRSDTVIVGRINCSCYLLTYQLCSTLNWVVLSHAAMRVCASRSCSVIGQGMKRFTVLLRRWSRHEALHGPAPSLVKAWSASRSCSVIGQGMKRFTVLLRHWSRHETLHAAMHNLTHPRFQTVKLLILHTQFMWSATDNERHCELISTDQTCLLRPHSVDDSSVTWLRDVAMLSVIDALNGRGIR